MCLIGVAWRAHRKFPLVLAANRDEFHARRSAPAGPWADHPQVFGGRDLAQHGSWLAATTGGRIAAITNVRRMVPPDPGSPSRGKLVAGFVTGTASAQDYAQSLAEDAAMYAGFNLLVGDGETLVYVTNDPEFRVETVTPGVHVVSNATLDTPWPKATRLRTALDSWCASNWESPGPLFQALADRVPASDAELPKTGLNKPLEKLLSSPFIVSPSYGTRCSTVVALSAGTLHFHEKRFGATGLESGHTEQSLARS